MRIRGDNAPSNAFSMEEQPKRPGFVLVRFYENILPFEETDGDLTISGYEYDEYHLELAYYAGLSDDILNNYDGYFAQAKLLEAESQVIPKLEQKVLDLEMEKATLTTQVATLDGQVTDTQIALCDVYEMLIGGVV